LFYNKLGQLVKGAKNMLTENEVRELLGNFQDPILHKTLKETDDVVEV